MPEASWNSRPLKKKSQEILYFYFPYTKRYHILMDILFMLLFYYYCCCYLCCVMPVSATNLLGITLWHVVPKKPSLLWTVWHLLQCCQISAIAHPVMADVVPSRRLQHLLSPPYFRHMLQRYIYKDFWLVNIICHSLCSTLLCFS